MRIDVLANARARRFHGHSRLDALCRASANSAGCFVTHDLDELDRVCEQLARRGTDLVALCGGDGTFMAGVTALARAFGEARLPRLALIPTGTASTVARNWGMAGDSFELLQALLRDPTSWQEFTRPSLRVREVSGVSRRERIGFIAGTGLVARFFDVYYAQGARGYAGAAQIVARVFAESFVGGAFARRVLHPIECTLEVDGKELAPNAWSLVCASVVPNLGLHMMLTYRAGEDMARPHLVASALPPKQLGPKLPHVICGARLPGAHHVDSLVSEFVLRFDRSAGGTSTVPNSAEGEGPYVLDGDVFRAHEVRVSAGPVLSVVCPPPGKGGLWNAFSDGSPRKGAAIRRPDVTET